MYDYKCNSCRQQYDELVSFSTPDSEMECPNCKEKNSKRMLSAPSISTKGSADYCSNTCNAPSGFS
ncbi:MAG: zinc ribbon domain-containing protein [Candidatus Marinimicrobia bacterium]|nr:zinc ribbon domain-containing protein [Candidatus Neomarinimicrobiota bacterium]